MPSLFPALLDFSLIGILIVRLLVGFFFWVFGTRLLQAAYGITGRSAGLRTLGFIYGFAKLAVGFFITIGLFTQVAGLVGMALSALTFIQGVTAPANKSAQQVQLLLFFMCLALVFLGAGAYGIDYQL